MVFGGLMLFGRAYKATIMRRTIWSYFGDSPSTIKSVAKKVETKIEKEKGSWLWFLEKESR